MFKLNWKIWLTVWLGIVAATIGVYFLLTAQGAASVALWLAFAGGLLQSMWVGAALIRWRDVPWVKRINTLVITTLGFGLVALLCRAVGWEVGWKTTGYLYLAAMGFLLGINLLRLILRPGHPILGVARTTVEEALRIGISQFFIIALLAIIVVIPLALGSEDRVTYMVQRFLVYSTFIVFALLGLMTVLVACWTVSKDLSSRQAHMTLTKPLARWQYLLGKWLGIILLDAVLVAVAGVAIYGFTMSIARNPALNDLDRYAVDREILTARLARNPDPINVTWDQMYMNVLEENQRKDPEKFGEVGDPIGALPESARQEVLAEAVSGFYSVDGGASKQYKFTGLADAVAASEASIERGRSVLREQAGLSEAEAEQYVRYVVGRPNELEEQTIRKVTMQVYDELVRELEQEKIQLVLTPDTSPEPDDQLLEFTMKINNQPWPRPRAAGMPAPRQKLVLETPNEFTIPASMIPPDGTLIVTLEVPEYRSDGVKQEFIQFNYKDAQIDLYYRVGSFETNLAKAMAVIWLKLVFLAMLGLALGALMSFPVAAMAGLVVFVAASASGVIDEALNAYAAGPRDAGTWETITFTVGAFFSNLGEGKVPDALRILIRIIGESFMLLIPKFGAFGTSDDLSSGRVIDNGLVLSAVLKIGLMWTGLIGLIGWGFFAKKELARVTV